jgi:hypothetical protein
VRLGIHEPQTMPVVLPYIPREAKPLPSKQLTDVITAGNIITALGLDSHRRLRSAALEKPLTLLVDCKVRGHVSHVSVTTDKA